VCMSKNENIKHEGKTVAFTRLFFPEIVNDLFSSPNPTENVSNSKDLDDFLKYLMYGFTATNDGMLVTLLDKKHQYNNGENYCEETGKEMHPFCSMWRKKCGMTNMCTRFDRFIAEVLLGSSNGEQNNNLQGVAIRRINEGTWTENRDAVIFRCYTGMSDMAYQIRVAGRPFAVLLAGQIPPDDDAAGIKDDLSNWLNRNPTNNHEINIDKLLYAMKAKTSDIPDTKKQPAPLIRFGHQLEKIFNGLYLTKRRNTEDAILAEVQDRCKQMEVPDTKKRLEPLIKFGHQLEKIFNDLYLTKRRNTEDAILAEVQDRCKQMKDIYARSNTKTKILSKLLPQILSEMLVLLKDALGFEAIMFFRGMGSLKPERNMKAIASSNRSASFTVDIHEFWNEILNDKLPILLCKQKWEKLRHYFNSTLGLNISDDHAAIVVANDYSLTATNMNPTYIQLPSLLLAVGDRSNLPDIDCFLRNLLRELESFITSTESQKELEEANRQRNALAKLHEHEISKNAQIIINLYSKFKLLANQFSDESCSRGDLRNRLIELNTKFLERARLLRDATLFPKTSVERENKDRVPEFELHKTKIDLVQLVDKSIIRYKSIGTERNIFIRWVKKPQQPMYSLVDERLLAIAVDEVLSNAVKYSFSSIYSSPVDVSLDSSTRDRCWKLSIRDFGLRIPSDKLEEVFEPGRRLELEERYRDYGFGEVERPGSGMGLTYVKTIIVEHGGHVSISCTTRQNIQEYQSDERERGHDVVVTILIPQI